MRLAKRPTETLCPQLGERHMAISVITLIGIVCVKSARRQPLDTTLKRRNGRSEASTGQSQGCSQRGYRAPATNVRPVQKPFPGDREGLLALGSGPVCKRMSARQSQGSANGIGCVRCKRVLWRVATRMYPLKGHHPSTKVLWSGATGVFETSSLPGCTFSSPADFTDQFADWLADTQLPSIGTTGSC